MALDNEHRVPTWLVACTAAVSPICFLLGIWWTTYELFAGYDPSVRGFLVAFCATIAIGLVGTLAAVIAAVRIRFPYRLLFWLIGLVDLVATLFILINFGVFIVCRLLG